MTGNWCECGRSNPPDAQTCVECGGGLVVDGRDRFRRAAVAPVARFPGAVGRARRVLRPLGLALVGACASCAMQNGSLSLGVPGVLVFKAEAGDPAAADDVLKAQALTGRGAPVLSPPAPSAPR